MLLDVATGEETPLSREMAWAIWLDEELLRGASGNGEKQYVVNLRPLAVIQLEPLPGGQEALPERIQEADSIYAIVTDSSLGKHMLLLLDRDSFGSVTEGYFIRGVRDLDTLLAGVPYGTPPPYRPCPGNEKVPSPDGRYYYILSGGLRIYSQQGKLLNTDARKDSYCYGWAWDSSGVYVQESKIGMFAPLRVSPLQLLLAEP